VSKTDGWVMKKGGMRYKTSFKPLIPMHGPFLFQGKQLNTNKVQGTLLRNPTALRFVDETTEANLPFNTNNQSGVASANNTIYINSSV